MTRSAKSLWMTGLNTSDVIKMHLVEKQDVLNWDVYMPNLSRNNWKESLLRLFSENSTFSTFSSTLMCPIFMPDDVNFSDVNA